ncbi:hypothetical protein P152DRAFT_299291 [Eremomyces bilateralis CBS 781.70]|uniref:Uncharacterized protein n=1 Tax=Eremomyces bilateralis CBS 781.70 TaxID=1392243 RepID=A0A6G1G7A1_9PEZI|nr:uncharacterized protein P152DRAFT_299291 [Eremomyces bilateralis CBS 781.70]KAF1813965.1 hypothetical protein P152DRAFT_299291 [Eremomyces bilateralis CBS 781.70]
MPIGRGWFGCDISRDASFLQRVTQPTDDEQESKISPKDRTRPQQRKARCKKEGLHSTRAVPRCTVNAQRKYEERRTKHKRTRVEPGICKPRIASSSLGTSTQTPSPSALERCGVPSSGFVGVIEPCRGERSVPGGDTACSRKIGWVRGRGG